MDIVLAWEDTPGPPIRYTNISKPILTMLIVLLEHSAAARNANPIEIGMRLHVRHPSGGNGVAVAVVEVSLDMMTTGGPTGIGIGIAQGVMRMTIVPDPDEVVAADPTMTDLMVTGRAVTATHLKLVMHCLPSSSIMSLLQQPHLWVTTCTTIILVLT